MCRTRYSPTRDVLKTSPPSCHRAVLSISQRVVTARLDSDHIYFRQCNHAVQHRRFMSNASIDAHLGYSNCRNNRFVSWDMRSDLGKVEALLPYHRKFYVPLYQSHFANASGKLLYSKTVSSVFLPHGEHRECPV